MKKCGNFPAGGPGIAKIVVAALACLLMNAYLPAAGRKASLSFGAPQLRPAFADVTAGPFAKAAAISPTFSLSPASRQEPDRIGPGAEDQKKAGRAALEFAVVMAASQTNYWLNYDRWREDWEYRSTWADQKRRFFGFEAWKFDTNRYGTNWTHSLSGAINYNIARSNGLSIAESLLFGLATSLYWEYIVEFKEVLSINDSILNPLSGMYLGEAWHQFGQFFAAKRGPAAGLVSLLNPIVKLNRWLDGGSGPGGMNPGGGGHDIHLDIGYISFHSERTPYPSDLIHLGFHGNLMNGPAWGGDRASDSGTGTAASELRARASIKAGKIEEIDLSSRIVWTPLLGGEAGPGTGAFAWTLGVGSGFSVLNKRGAADYDLGKVDYGDLEALRLEESRNFRDKFCVTHIIGPAFDASVRRSGLTLRMKWDAYIDFCLMNAFALNAYSRLHPVLGLRPTLLYYGYYYGRGLSTLAGFSADWEAFRLNGGAAYHSARSLRGRERFQGTFEEDVAPKDSRLRFELGLGVRLPGIPARVALTWEGVNRAGAISDVTDSDFEDKVFVDLQFIF